MDDLSLNKCNFLKFQERNLNFLVIHNLQTRYRPKAFKQKLLKNRSKANRNLPGNNIRILKSPSPTFRLNRKSTQNRKPSPSKENANFAKEVFSNVLTSPRGMVERLQFSPIRRDCGPTQDSCLSTLLSKLKAV